MKWLILFFSFAAIFYVTHIPLLSAVTIDSKVTTTAQRTILAQSDYRWYQNIDSLTPTGELASENTATSTPASGSVVRLRINIADSSAELSVGATFKLQYSLSTSSGWTDLASSTAWIFFDNPGVADGQVIVSTVLTDSNVGESYGESNPSATSPVTILPSQKGEWDWAIQNNSASTESNWYFRMIYSSSTELDSYENFPALTIAPSSTAPTSTPSGGTPGGTSGYIPRDEDKIPPVKIPPAPREILKTVDLNGDGRIDMQDLSILLYYYGKRDVKIEHTDFNGDGIVDLADVSILLFYWTG